jgi:hypothetical protein
MNCGGGKSKTSYQTLPGTGTSTDTGSGTGTGTGTPTTTGTGTDTGSGTDTNTNTNTNTGTNTGTGSGGMDLYSAGTSYARFYPKKIYIGCPYDSWVRVQNAGAEASGPFSVDLYLSKYNTSYSTDDIYIASTAMGSIAGGAYDNCVFSGVIPDDPNFQMWAWYYPVFVIDFDNAVDETDEANNVGYSYTYNPYFMESDSIDIYDYSSTYWEHSPTVVDTGDSFNAVTRIRNQGILESGAFKVAFYLTPDTFLSDTADYNIGNADMASIQSDEIVICNMSCTIPSGIPAGSYYIGWIIDIDNAVDEKDREYNNTVVNSNRKVLINNGTLTFGQKTCNVKNVTYGTGSIKPATDQSYPMTDDTMHVYWVGGSYDENIRAWACFDTSQIPDGAFISRITYHFNVSVITKAFISVRIYSLSVDPTDPGSAPSTICGAGTQVGTTPIDTPLGWKEVEVKEEAPGLLQTQLPDDWFALKFYGC